MIELSVRFVKRIYGKPDGNFSVFSAETVDTEGERLIEENRFGNFTIAGDFTIDDDELGGVYTVTIEKDYNSKYPSSYKMIKLHYEFPKTAKEQWDYLENGNIVPFGTFLSIKKTFDKTDKILDIIVDEPERLQKVKGIGEKRARTYQNKLMNDKEKAAIFTEYGDIDGVGASVINTLLSWKPSVDDVIKAIKKDPFSLLENDGIGFMVADKFREFYGVPLNDENRILHGVKYYLEEGFQSSGNTYEEILVISKDIARRLLVSYEEVVQLLAKIKDDANALRKYKLKVFGKNISTQELFLAELLIYKKTNDLMKTKRRITSKERWAEIMEEELSSMPEELSKEQKEFLEIINEERVSVLLGPGGSGKSWAINIACNMIKKAGRSYGLYAPTARAAHVMGEYVGVEAQTIHRGLMPTALSGEPAEHDVLIVDEYSMVDSELASVVLKTMGTHTRLIIVGDDYQLQSVGPGNVLFDLVENIKVPTIRLTKIFRQDDGSGVLDYARDLREGTFNLPTSAPRIEYNDITFINESDDARKQAIAMKLYERAYKAGNPVEEIMLLSPVNNGSSGRRTLNKRVQELVNPASGNNEVVFGANLENEEDKRYFKHKDYITVTKNNYDMIDDEGELSQIINGDLGKVVNTRRDRLTFEVNDHEYTIDKSDINELIDHAWAITIHKSQGGQANEVIIVLPENSYFMLNSNMLYTAITRTKMKCTVIGSFRGINEAASKQSNLNRKTMIQLQSDSNK